MGCPFKGPLCSTFACLHCMLNRPSRVLWFVLISERCPCTNKYRLQISKLEVARSLTSFLSMNFEMAERWLCVKKEVVCGLLLLTYMELFYFKVRVCCVLIEKYTSADMASFRSGCSAHDANFLISTVRVDCLYSTKIVCPCRAC